MKNCRRLSGRKTGCTFTSLGKRPGIRTAGKGRLPEESGKHGISGGIFLASALAAWFSLLPGGQARAEEGIVVPAGTVIAGGGQTSNYDHFSWQMNQTLSSPDITFEGNSGGGVEAKGGWRSVFLFDNTSAQGAEGAGAGTTNGLHFTASNADIHSGFASVIVNADTKAHGNVIALTDTALYGDWGNAIGALIATAGEISDNKISLSGGSASSSQAVLLLGNVPFTRTAEEYVFTYGPGAAERINGNTVEASGTKLTSAGWGIVSVAAASQEVSGNTFTLDFGDPGKTSADIETAGFSFISAGRMNSSLDNCDMPSAAAVSSDNVLTLKNGMIAAPVSADGRRGDAYRGFFGIRADVQSSNTLNLENVTLEGFQLPQSRDGIVGLSGRQISDSTVSVKDSGVWSMGSDSGSYSTNSSIVAIQGAMSMDKELGAGTASGYTVSGSRVSVENSIIHSGGGVYGIAGDLNLAGGKGRHNVLNSATDNTIWVKGSSISSPHQTSIGIIATKASGNTIILDSTTINPAKNAAAETSGVIGILAPETADNNTISITGATDSSGANVNSIFSFMGMAGIAGSEVSGNNYTNPSGGTLTASNNRIAVQHMDLVGQLNGITGIAAKNASGNTIIFSDGTMSGSFGFMGIGMRSTYFDQSWNKTLVHYSESADGNTIILRNGAIKSGDSAVSVCGIKASTITGNILTADNFNILGDGSDYHVPQKVVGLSADGSVTGNTVSFTNVTRLSAGVEGLNGVAGSTVENNTISFSGKGKDASVLDSAGCIFGIRGVDAPTNYWPMQNYLPAARAAGNTIAVRNLTLISNEGGEGLLGIKVSDTAAGNSIFLQNCDINSAQGLAGIGVGVGFLPVTVRTTDGSQITYTGTSSITGNTIVLDNVTLRVGESEKGQINSGAGIYAARGTLLSGNTLVASGIEIKEPEFAGNRWVIPLYVGGFAASGEASDNTVSFSGLRGIKASTGGIFALAAETARNNTISLSGEGDCMLKTGGSVAGIIGQQIGTNIPVSWAAVNADGNRISLENINIDSQIRPVSSVNYGGPTGSVMAIAAKNASNNIITLQGGSVTTHLTGAAGIADIPRGNFTYSDTAMNNVISVSGTSFTFKDQVTAGLAGIQAVKAGGNTVAMTGVEITDTEDTTKYAPVSGIVGVSGSSVTGNTVSFEGTINSAKHYIDGLQAAVASGNRLTVQNSRISSDRAVSGLTGIHIIDGPTASDGAGHTRILKSADTGRVYNVDSTQDNVLIVNKSSITSGEEGVAGIHVGGTSARDSIFLSGAAISSAAGVAGISAWVNPGSIEVEAAGAASGSTVSIKNSDIVSTQGAVYGIRADTITDSAFELRDSNVKAEGYTNGDAGGLVAENASGNTGVLGGKLSFIAPVGSLDVIRAFARGTENTGWFDHVEISVPLLYFVHAERRANNNSLLVEGGTINADLRCAESDQGTSASGNTMVMRGTTVNAGVLATAEARAGEADGNTMIISSSSVTAERASAGISDGSSAKNNSVSVSDSVFSGHLAAGMTKSGDVSGNTVLVRNSRVGGHVYGGFTVSGLAGGNTVILEDSHVSGYVYGGQSEAGHATGNTVIVRNTSVSGGVYGNYIGTGDAGHNYVYINSGIGGGVEASHTRSGDASDNVIVMEGGTVFDRLYGGYTEDGSASRNSITVTAGRVRAAVVGGYDDGTAVDNTVTLYDTASFAGSDLYGGKTDGTSSDVFTGNTLNLHGQIQADSLQNFQNLNFSDVADGTPSADLAKSAVLGDGKGSFTNVSIQNLRNQSGDVPEEYVLVHTPAASSSFTGTNLYVNGADTVTIGSDGSYVPYTGTVSNDGTVDNETGTAGMTRSQAGLTKGFLTFDVDYFIKNGQDLIARTKNVRADHRTKSFNIDRLPGLALLDQGGDLAAGAGMESAEESAMCLPGEEPCGTRAFMAVSGGYSTYKADGHFNMSGGSAMAGLARYCKLPSVGFLAGVFFETGIARFDAEHDFTGYDSFDSEGNASYYGVGALGKLYLNETAMQGLYAEGSFRIGMLNYSWESDGWRVNGSDVDYSSQSPYMAAHGGIGWMKSLTDSVDLDIYAKYLWSHVSEDDSGISGSRVSFDAMDSNRLRGGARLSFKGSDAFSWYLGAAYERQFNGRSASDVYGHDTPSASLKGDTAMVEAGLQLKPSKEVPVSFLLGASGYAGTREGVSGTFQIRYEF